MFGDVPGETTGGRLATSNTSIQEGEDSGRGNIGPNEDFQIFCFQVRIILAHCRAPVFCWCSKAKVSRIQQCRTAPDRGK
jgi:hypothetical protein